MSYVVHALAVDPLPHSADEAFAALKQANSDTLEAAQSETGSSGMSPPALSTLAERLWLVYPQDAHGQIDSDGPWLEGLPAPSPGSRVWSLGLNTSARPVERAYEQLLNHCAALGLVVLDSQLGVAVLPDGTVLGGVLVLPKAPEIEYDPEDFVPGGRVNYYPREAAEAVLSEQVRDDLLGFMQAHEFTLAPPLTGDSTARFARVHGQLQQRISVWVNLNNWTVLHFGGGVVFGAGIEFPNEIKEIEKICRPRQLAGRPVDFTLSIMWINLENYLESVDPHYFRHERADYAHIPAASSLKLEDRWRNLKESDPKKPSMISYRDGLTFTNQHELLNVTLPRLRHFVNDAVLPIFDRLRNINDIADYALETYPNKTFCRQNTSDPAWMAMWLIAVGLARPQRLLEFAERFRFFMNHGYVEMINKFGWPQDPVQRQTTIEAYQSHFREYIDAILNYFDQKLP